MLEDFHRSLSEHIISLEARNKANHDRDGIEAFNKLKSKKDVSKNLLQEEVKELAAENIRLNQTIQNLTKRLDKSERRAENNQEGE